MVLGDQHSVARLLRPRRGALVVSLATPGVRAWAVRCQGLMTLSGVSKLSGPQVRGAHGPGGT